MQEKLPSEVVNLKDVGLFDKYSKLVTSLEVNRKHFEESKRELGLPKNKLHSRGDFKRTNYMDIEDKPTYRR